jgi:isopentenyldiphosphate isomerase
MDEEYLDIVDDNDEVIGKELRNKIYSGNTPIKKIRYVNIFIFNSRGQILLPKRSMNCSIFQGCYDFSAAGHVNSGEDYEQAAMRELEEELGLKNQKLIELGKLTPKDGVTGFCKIYRLIFDGNLDNHDKGGIASLEWFEFKDALKLAEEYPEKFKHDVPIVLRWYAKKVGFKK